MNLKTLALTLAMAAFAMSACKKDNNTTDNDTSSAGENAVAGSAFSDAADIANEAYTGALSSYKGGTDEKIMTTCATITLDTLATPKKFTIDFGTTDCLCKDGNYRRGQIIVTYTGMYRDSGSSHTITFNNYYVNNNKIDGTKTVTNNGRNSAGNLTYTITDNGTITWDPTTYSGGGTTTYSSNRTREWSAGESTPTWSDDIYLISGTESGTTRSGSNYTVSTSQALKKEIGFRHFTAGILNFTPQGKATRTIDFGYLNGNRDNLAQVTISGYTFTVNLK